MRALSTAFVGGHVYDGTSMGPVRTDVGVVTGRVVALGEAEVAERIGPRTRRVDLAGRLLLPGFVDAHVHPIQGGSERLGCDLSAGRTKQDYLDRVRDYAVRHPQNEWIVGGGWAQAAFPGGSPTVEDLDQISPDRPVVLSNRDHHSAWVNSATLRLAGIDRTTSDPTDGRIDRLADGQPSGTVHEGARTAVLDLAPEQTEQSLYEALLEGQRVLHAVGVTGWQDALIGDYGNHRRRYVDVYSLADDRGALTARVSGALWWDRGHGLEQVEGFIRTRAEHRSGNFLISSVKVMQDGIPENRTAALIEPYLGSDGSAAERGLSFLEPKQLQECVTALDQEGFQVHFHAIGDRAVRESLDAVAAARRHNRRPGVAHQIAHVQIVDPDDVGRFADLGVAANIQPLWASYDPQMVELNLPLLGQDRAERQYPFASLLAAGADLCAGSDWPVTSPDPWLGIHVAVNRQHPEGHPDRSTEVFLPWQKLTLAQALRAYTSASARINGRGHYTGLIRRGYAADLVVLDRNPFERPPEEIHLTTPLETLVAGDTVYHAQTG